MTFGSPPPVDSKRPGHEPRISVMVVDDSAVTRGLMTRMLEREPDITVAISAGDGQGAIAFLKRMPVDVVLLDIEMPNMDGLEAIPKLLHIKPDVKIIMVSTITLRNAKVSMKALSLGAADYIPKPTALKDIGSGIDFNRELLEKVRAWGRRRPPPAQLSGRQDSAAPHKTERPSRPVVLRKTLLFRPDAIAIASSTGGPQALFSLMPHFKGISQPVFITQHMPSSFTTTLASHITGFGANPCAEAKNGDVIKDGQVYLAPGNFHMTVAQEDANRVIRLNQEPPENYCRPAADPMLRSLSAVYKSRLLVVVLTGMGTDGCKGSKVVVDAGGGVVAQDQATSVVWGMPGAVAEAGLCHAVLSLAELGPYVMNIVKKGGA